MGASRQHFCVTRTAEQVMHGLNELGFKALRLFVAVLDHGSFSEVARREGLAPSSISRQVQLMEQALNQQLLYPHTRAVSPTAAGRRSEEHTSEPQSQIRISYAVFFLKKKKIHQKNIQSY